MVEKKFRSSKNVLREARGYQTKAILDTSALSPRHEPDTVAAVPSATRLVAKSQLLKCACWIGSSGEGLLSCSRFDPPYPPARRSPNLVESKGEEDTCVLVEELGEIHR